MHERGGQVEAEPTKDERILAAESTQLMRSGAPSDTDPAIEAFLVEGYRRMTPAQKLELVGALTRTVRQLALADVRRRYPNADEREQALRVASHITPSLSALSSRRRDGSST